MKQNLVSQNNQPPIKPIVQTIIETALRLAEEDFKSKNYSVRLVKIGKGQRSYHEYYVHEGDGQGISRDFQRLIFKESKIKIAKTDDLVDSLQKAEEIYNMVLTALVKENLSLNGRYDKDGNRV